MAASHAPGPARTPPATLPLTSATDQAGGVAGTAVDLSLYPIDTLKTRLQSAAGFARSGGFRGIYRGVGSALVGSAPGAALFFTTYEQCKAALRQQQWRWRWSEPAEHMAAASVGEVAACIVRVPTEVVKQRAQASAHPTSSWATLQRIIVGRQRRTTVGGGGGGGGGLARVVATDLYRGWTITLLRELPFTAIQFPLWEAMKAWRRRSTGREPVPAGESAVFGSVAGAAAAAVTTPLDVVKTRVMLAPHSERIAPLVARIWRQEGLRPFFAGIGPRVLWISAGGAIFLGSYQWAFNAFSGAR
ncbi:MAG: S-adenosylmethionine transporter [Phylliscum demangeonii]|nr:MAG: S-adenosylmethionine transporter [Phylliscum demangeonii]